MTDKLTSGASYGSAGGLTAFGVLSVNELALLVGIIFTAATFGVNWYYTHRRDSRERVKQTVELAPFQCPMADQCPIHKPTGSADHELV